MYNKPSSYTLKVAWLSGIPDEFSKLRAEFTTRLNLANPVISQIVFPTCHIQTHLLQNSAMAIF